MNSRLVSVFAVALVLTAAALPIPGRRAGAIPQRDFEFTYQTKIPPAPKDSKISRVWIPIPRSDANQTISNLKVDTTLKYVRGAEREYGNEYLFLDIPAEKAGQTNEVQLGFRVTRREHQVALATQPVSAKSSTRMELQRYLQADRRVPLDGVIAELSAQQTNGIQDPLAKARAVYDYVLATMRYDKTGTGWGNGDAIWACTAKRGNCTDFHSLFIGMMRAAGVPARFEIGFSVPEGQHEGAIAGYHCWAEFYVEPYGWIPVDASEAWKHPEKRDYFFGAHDDNRVQFTLGRDIRLNPPQQGDPLNYFIYPYAEVNGKPLALEAKFSFRDVAANGD